MLFQDLSNTMKKHREAEPLASGNKSILNLHLSEPSKPFLNILPTQLPHLYLMYSRLGSHS